MDVDLSVYADSVLNRYLSNVEKGYPASMRYDSVPKNSVDINTRYLQGGILLMENSTGQVLAMLGGRNLHTVNLTALLRQKDNPEVLLNQPIIRQQLKRAILLPQLLMMLL